MVDAIVGEAGLCDRLVGAAVDDLWPQPAPAV
jgi:hypothetical protein